VVAGFSVSRAIASSLLVPEPPGTFLCRLSMSSGTGGLALAVQTGGGHMAAGPDGVMHVLITSADVAHRDVRTLLRTYSGTSHLLDVYSGKRLDKRMVSVAHCAVPRGTFTPAIGCACASFASMGVRKLCGCMQHQ
jgi:hypothetical protein